MSSARLALAAALGAAIVLAPAVSHAQRAEAGSEAIAWRDTSASVRSMSNDWLIPPRGWQLSSSLSYVTSDGGVGDAGLAFTDVVFLRLGGHWAVKGKAEISAGIDLLPKQPSYTDELVFEGAHLGARVGIKRWLAADLRLDEGTLMDQTGFYGAGHAGLVARHAIAPSLALQGHVGGAFTPLRFDQGGTAWFAEVQTQGDVVFRFPEGSGALWFGFGFAFPVSHKGSIPGVGGLDPRTRADVQVGVVFSLLKKWDVYAQAAVIDRGDYAAPRTMVPVLDGGFDQRQYTFGLVRHFAQDKRERGYDGPSIDARRDPDGSPVAAR